MSEQLEEIKKMFPTSKEFEIAGKIILVKPMVWTDFLIVIEDFGKVFIELTSKHPDFDPEKFNVKDLGKIIPVINEVFNIGARWLGQDSKWLRDNLTPLKTVQLVNTFMEVNEWEEVKSCFFQAKANIKKTKSLDRKI